MSVDQAEALEQLREIDRRSGGTIEVRSVAPPSSDSTIVDLSIACGGFERANGGLPLREREIFTLVIPQGYPFVPPAIWVPHTRFAAFEHVQWGRHLCMYQSLETEWSPSDGMFGLVTRLLEWLKRGALNDFEPAGAPLHPPAVYATPTAVGTVVPRAAAPQVTSEPWLGLADLAVVHEARVDIVAWSARSFVPAEGHRAATAILLAGVLPFEYPAMLADLLDRLAEHGLDRELILLLLVRAVLCNSKETPLHVIVGSPMRGTSGSVEREQHLAAWRIEPWLADGLRLLVHQFSDDPELKRIGGDVEQIVRDWAAGAKIEWCVVREARPEVTVRRDGGTPVARAFAGKAVAIWGCGALGGRIAEYLARAGVRKVMLHDAGVVAPGILVRQPFVDEDIGCMKAERIAALVRAIDPRIDVVVHTENLLVVPLDQDDWTGAVDVIVDASASLAVLEKLERRRAKSTVTAVPIVSIAVDQDAERGLVLVAGANHTGGPADVARAVKLAVTRHAELRAFFDAFWPASDRRRIFQPEPGCSAATFIGSAADTASLAGRMLNVASAALSSMTQSSLTAVSHLIGGPEDERAGRNASFTFGPDVVMDDMGAGYQIRVRPGAWADIEGWVARGARTLGPARETGGVLFGERNDAARVLWVDEILGPPPDSQSSAMGFLCGTNGVREANEEKRHRTREAVSFIGMWHTHPDSRPTPSATDDAGMAEIVARVEASISKAVLVIVATSRGTPSGIGGYVFSRRDLEPRADNGSSPRSNVLDSSVAALRSRRTSVQRPPSRQPPKRIGLALSGGGSRAIAFHLGALRACHDRRVLDQVQVLSTVSGGSVIGALYAYSNGDFAAFDAQVVEVLREGLVGSLVRRTFFSGALFRSLFTMLTANALALAVGALRAGSRFLPANVRRSVGRLPVPLRRWHSRTTAFASSLDRTLFRGIHVDDVKRSSRHGTLEVVINATELRTGTAFRFGNRTTGATRFGHVATPVPLPLAVAASAAYPALLPALDLDLEFESGGNRRRQRVLLTDGGVYENLGTACMEPGRTAEISTHVYSPEYIIACDAGSGVTEGASIPYWWPSRMAAAFETVFRRVQNDTRHRLHDHVASGRLRGFVMPYLGQFDDRLPWKPHDLVPREDVIDYPTDFSPMSDENIARLTTRGEQLTRVLLSQYAPDL